MGVSNSMASQSRINEIEYRLNAATRAPWDCDGLADGDHVHLSIFEGSNQGRVIAEGITRHSDADLLLNAPADIAYLLSVIKEQAS